MKFFTACFLALALFSSNTSAQINNYRLHERFVTFDQNGSVTTGAVTSQTPDSLSGNTTAGQKNMIHHLGTFYHVYHSSVDGDADVYLRKSTDGINWTAPVTVNDDSANASQLFPSLAVWDSGSVVKLIVGWRDDRLAANNVQFRVAVSNNGGNAFHPSVQLSSHNDLPLHVLGNVAVDAGGNVYAAWFRDLGGNVNGNWFSRSLNGGYMWLPMSSAFNGSVPNPCQIVTRNSGEVLLITSEDQFNKKNLIAVASSDSGATWTNQQFTPYTAFQEIAQFHSTTVDDSGIVHTVWTYEINTADFKIYYARSNDFGQTWSTPVQVSDSGVNLLQTWNYNMEQWPSVIRSDNNRLYVSWSDEREDLAGHDMNVYIATSTDNGATWSTNTMMNDLDTVLYQAQTSIAVRSVFTNDEVLVTWIDNRSENIAIGVDEIGTTSTTYVYPNPFDQTLHFKTSHVEPCEIVLYDMTSKEIFRQPFVKSTSLNTSALSAGFYLYKVVGGNGLVDIGKVVKQ